VSVRRKEKVVPTLMVLPYLLLMSFCAIVPVIYGALEVPKPSFVNLTGGYDTFLKVLQDFRLGAASLNILFLLLIFVPLMIVTVLVISLLMDSVEIRANNVMRLVFLIPALIPTGVAVLFWFDMVGPEVIWNSSNIRWFIGCVIFSTSVGGWIVIQYGSLRSISQEVLEAGVVDGCNRFQLAWRLKVPLIARYVAYMAILLVVNTLQIFTEPNLLLSTKVTTDWSFNQIAFSYAFSYGDFSGGTAISLTLLLPNIILALLFACYTDFLRKQQRA